MGCVVWVGGRFGGWGGGGGVLDLSDATLTALYVGGEGVAKNSIMSVYCECR